MALYGGALGIKNKKTTRKINVLAAPPFSSLEALGGAFGCSWGSLGAVLELSGALVRSLGGLLVPKSDPKWLQKSLKRKSQESSESQGGPKGSPEHPRGSFLTYFGRIFCDVLMIWGFSLSLSQTVPCSWTLAGALSKRFCFESRNTENSKTRFTTYK